MPATENELRTRVLEFLEKQAIDHFVIIDDGLEPTLTHAHWIEIVEILNGEDEATLETISEYIEQNGKGGVRDEQPASIHPRLTEMVSQSSSERAVELAKNLPFRESELDRLIQYIVEAGIEIRKHTSIDEVPTDSALYFIDYTLNESLEDAGTHASEFLAKVVDKVLDTGHPPAVFLMSRNNPKRDEWEKVAQNAGFYRFCFRYLDKPQLVKTPAHFYYYLDEMLETLPLGKSYIIHLTSVRQSIELSIDSVIGQLFRLTPSDFSEYAIRYLQDKEGRRAAKHLQYLFLRLLETELDNSVDVARALKDFGITLKETHLRIRGDDESEILHKLHARIVYDRSDSAKTGDLAFGDIITTTEGEETIFFLLITPECDLEVRSGGTAKVEILLFVEGQTVQQKLDYEYLEHTELLEESKDGVIQWIAWSLRRPKTIAITEIDQYERWGRLRFEYAERIQQKFASDLLEVGTEEVFSAPRILEVSLFGGKDGNVDQGRIKLMEYRLNGKILWAFCEDCHALFENPERAFIPPQEVASFQRIQSASELRKACLKHNILFVKGVLGIAVVYRPGGAIAGWNAPEGWDDAKEME